MKYTQQQIIIKWLREHKEGLNSYDATYKVLYPELYPKKIKQAPTRKSEINEMGYITVSRNNPDGSVNWILVHSPVVKEVKQSPSFNEDDYDWSTGTAILKTKLEPEQGEMFV